MIKDTPILFTPHNAVLVDRELKRQTRRLDGLDAINLDPHAWSFSGHQDDQWIVQHHNPSPGHTGLLKISCPYGTVGDRLWVREAYRFGANWDAYKPSDVPPGVDLTFERDTEDGFWGKRRPSIFMPTWACRLHLEITDVRLQRLQEINENDAIAEGVDHASPVFYDGKNHDDEREDSVYVPQAFGSFATDNFRRLWESIHGPMSWDRNDWVWALTFQKVKL